MQQESLSCPKVLVVTVVVTKATMVIVQRQVTGSLLSWRHPPVPHATFGVIVVEEVPQVDPLHLKPCLKDPRGQDRRAFFYGFSPNI